MTPEHPMSLAPQLAQIEHRPDLELGDDQESNERQPPYLEAGLLSYYAGLMGSAAFMLTAIGPGWLGFVAVFTPAVLLASAVIDRV